MNTNIAYVNRRFF